MCLAHLAFWSVLQILPSCCFAHKWEQLCVSRLKYILFKCLQCSRRGCDLISFRPGGIEGALQHFFSVSAHLARQNNKIFALSHREANNKIRIRLMKGQPVREKNETITSTPSLVTHMQGLVIITVSVFYVKWKCMYFYGELHCAVDLNFGVTAMKWENLIFSMFSQWLICQIWNCLKVRS